MKKKKKKKKRERRKTFREDKKGGVWVPYGQVTVIYLQLYFFGKSCKQTMPVSGGRKPGHRGDWPIAGRAGVIQAGVRPLGAAPLFAAITYEYTMTRQRKSTGIGYTRHGKYLDY